MTAAGAPLARRLGTGDAVVVGLSAMVGAGVFVVFAPAAASAGAGLLVALAIAAVVAFCNATSSAQLASAHPASGGTYLFGRVVLGPWWGFLAGWGFVVGKSASCAAMAMTAAAYALPQAGTAGQRVAAAAAVVALTVATARGITRTAQVARVLLGVTLLVLVGALVLLGAGVAAGTAAADPWRFEGGALGVLQAAGLLFFAFAGYARIATLAEEVRRPAVLGRAVVLALGVTVVLYTGLAVLLLQVLGPTELAASATPVADAVAAVGAGQARPAVQVGAVTAALGALLALLAGVGRTTLAMARERDLPGALAAVHPVHQVPAVAQAAVCAVVLVLVLVADLRGAVGFSSFGVLVYYAVANASALRQPPEQRRWPRAVAALGLVGCVVLALTLPLGSVLVGAAVLGLGLGGRWVALRRRSAG